MQSERQWEDAGWAGGVVIAGVFGVKSLCSPPPHFCLSSVSTL